MTLTISRILTSSVLLAVLLLGGASVTAAASEVTGTLSSDGSTEATAGSASQTEAAIMLGGSSQQVLSGTVVNGIDNQEGSAALTALLWSLPVVVLIAAVLVGITWRNRRNRIA